MMDKLTGGEERAAFSAGVDNLLHGCLNAKAGEHLLIFHEPPGHQFYCEKLASSLAHSIEQRGVRVSLAVLPVVEDADSLTDEDFAPAKDVDYVLYLARCGDQMRFTVPPISVPSVICYVMNDTMMASRFASTPHALMLAVKDAVDISFNTAKNITIECPLGTRVDGSVTVIDAAAANPQVSRFPHSVCTPVLANTFSGRIVIPNFLVGTGSRYFTPFAVELSAPLSAYIENGRILGFDGHAGDVKAAQTLHADVAERYGIEADVVHSWHAGIHPGLDYDMPAQANFERWSGAAFGNPRILHFHACGDYAPGEISWNVIDATVTVDGVTLWDAGRLQTTAFPGADKLAAQFPGMSALFSDPATNIGL